MHAGLAAELATEIDRLALCIHRPTGRRSDLMAALSPLGMPRQSIVVVAARFLAAGRLSFADYASVSRYVAAADSRKLLDAHGRRGLIVEGELEVFTPSPAFQTGACVVLRMQGEEAERLWSPAAAVRKVAALARVHVEAALDSALPLDAFRRQAEVHHVVPTTDAAQLLGYITELRYLRSDVHAACLADEGLSGPSARTLHRLWRGHDADGAIDAVVIDAGLVERGDEPRLTPRGAEVFERVEASTNQRFASVFAVIGDEQSSHLLDGMRALSGEDPRPKEDR